jgi:hypothetical protein
LLGLPMCTPAALALARPSPVRDLRRPEASRVARLEQDTPEWRHAVQMLTDAADDRGAILLAKIGMDRALNRKIK